MLLPHIIMGLYLGTRPLEKASRKLLESLIQVEVSQSDDGPEGIKQGFQVTFGAHRPGGSSADYALVKEPLLLPGNRLVVTITIAATPQVLIDGIITHQQLPFGGGNGDANLVITGHDISILMDLEDKRKSYKGMKHKEVVEQILSAYAKFGISADVKKPTSQWPMEPPKQMPAQMGVTDRAYLRALAAANGFIFRIKPGPSPGQSVAYWGPPPRNTDQQIGLTINMGTRTNVETVSFSFDGLAAAEAGGSVASANEGEASAAKSSKSTRKPALAQGDPLAESRPLLRKVWLGYAGPDANEAQARAQAIADQTAEQAVSATGTLDTLRYGALLTAPGVVGVRGVGGSFDGDYYVKSVKHRISITEYKQDFTIRREGLGTKTQKVKTK